MPNYSLAGILSLNTWLYFPLIPSCADWVLPCSQCVWIWFDVTSNVWPSLFNNLDKHTVYPKKYAHGFVVLCFVVVMQSFIMNSHEVFIHNHQGCFAGTGAIVRLPQCQWSKPYGYRIISECITTTKHSKAKNVCIFLGIYYSFLTEVLSVALLFGLELYFLSLVHKKISTC